MNMRVDATEASSATIVVPAEVKVIHPPDLWLTCDCNIDSNGIKIHELIGESNWDQRAVLKSRASWNSVGLLSSLVGLLSG